MKTTSTFQWSDGAEAGICLRLNRVTRFPWLRDYFRGVSRLGNGMLWYSVVAALPFVQGLSFESLTLTVHVGITALCGVLVYKLCKRLLVRERPFVTHADILCHGVPLDRGSFPSGHTIHAVCFTVMLGSLFPATLWILVPLAISIALSRVILGHHYPSDVLAGAIIGAYLAQTSLELMAFTLH